MAQPQVPQKAPEVPPEIRRRKDKPHASLYLDRRVIRVLKEVALPYDKKVHDLLIEGVNMVLHKYGRPSVEEIARGGENATTG
jgi:hypothetical protein